jgi:type III pantothenate kinase
MGEKSVSEKPNALLIDMGNSQIKYTLIRDPKAAFEVSVAPNTCSLEALIKLCDKVLISSVRDPQQVTAIADLCRADGKLLQIIKTEAQTFGIECAYDHYQTLGVDRWLAILAARKITSLAVAVIDLGTANTCDFIIGNKHIGGWIAPGFSTMRDSLIANTQRVFANNDYPSALKIGQSTEQCVNMGCIAAIQGLVSEAQHQLEMLTQGENYRVIVTGGDKNLLGQCSKQAILFQENLVLQGLARYL